MSEPILTPELINAVLARLDAPALSLNAEAIAIRELAASTGAPDWLITRLWRELAGEQRRRSGAPPISLFGGRSPARTAELARIRFGLASRLSPVDKAETALAAAKAPGGLAVLALDPQDGWWLRLLAEPNLRVVAALSRHNAFVVSSEDTGPTGGDETYWVTDAPGAASRVVEALGAAGFAAETVSETGGLKLMALAGYVQAHDPRLDACPGRLKGVIGSSPQPFDF
jgi:hypothetical protein